MIFVHGTSAERKFPTKNQTSTGGVFAAFGAQPPPPPVPTARPAGYIKAYGFITTRACELGWPAACQVACRRCMVAGHPTGTTGAGRYPHCSPHLFRTCSAIAPHFTPHLCHTCAALVPQRGRIDGAASSGFQHAGGLYTTRVSGFWRFSEMRWLRSRETLSKAHCAQIC